MTTDEELKAVHGMFTDTWRLYKQYADIRQGEDGRWEAFLEEASALARKYDNGLFARDLLMAAINELERRSKEPPAASDSGV